MNVHPWQIKMLDKMIQLKGRGFALITGRQMGKSKVNDFLRHYYANVVPTPTIKWQQLPGLKLQAYVDEIGARGFERGLRETDMDPIQAWSDECNCGVRMSFNVWKFENEKQITMFLIRWSN
jgi:hypothetical protein